MRPRLFAFIVALVLAATPLLSIVCQVDCDQASAVPTCHESASSPGGPTVRGAQHGCNQDHSTGDPALLASGAARDSIGALLALPLGTVAPASLPGTGVAIVAMHGPPGLSGRRTTPPITILRI